MSARAAAAAGRAVPRAAELPPSCSHCEHESGRGRGRGLPLGDVRGVTGAGRLLTEISQVETPNPQPHPLQPPSPAAALFAAPRPRVPRRKTRLAGWAPSQRQTPDGITARRIALAGSEASLRPSPCLHLVFRISHTYEMRPVPSYGRNGVSIRSVDTECRCGVWGLHHSAGSDVTRPPSLATLPASRSLLP